MSDSLDPVSKLRREQNDDNRLEAEAAADAASIRRSVYHNSKALAAYEGIDIDDDSGVGKMYFDEIIKLRSEVYASLGACEAITDESRQTLTSLLMRADLHGGDAAGEIAAVRQCFLRWSNSSSDEDRIADRPQKLIERARYLADR